MPSRAFQNNFDTVSINSLLFTLAYNVYLALSTCMCIKKYSFLLSFGVVEKSVKADSESFCCSFKRQRRTILAASVRDERQGLIGCLSLTDSGSFPVTDFGHHRLYGWRYIAHTSQRRHCLLKSRRAYLLFFWDRAFVHVIINYKCFIFLLRFKASSDIIQMKYQQLQLRLLVPRRTHSNVLRCQSGLPLTDLLERAWPWPYVAQQ